VTNAPTAESFWIEPGRLLAGKYPGGDAATVRALLDAGIRSFVDLTEEGELRPYGETVGDGVAWLRRPIPDFSVTTRELMRETLDAIDAALERGPVYVHCWGGCGRTGTVIGCWLVRHGAEPEEALERFHGLSAAVCRRRCPETDEQRAMVLGWAEGG